MTRRLLHWLWTTVVKVGGLLAVLIGGVLVVSLALTLYIRGPSEAARDWSRLRLSGPRASAAETLDRFGRLYAERLGPEPRADDLRRHFGAQLAAHGWFTLDSVMTDYILNLEGQIDRRTLPPGVYVALRAVGPDEPPLVGLTQYLYHFGLFARHGYVLVVPADGETARVYSAGLEGDFVESTSAPMQLYARGATYEPAAYDFPRQGQAVHEIVAVTRDLEEISAVEARIRELEPRIRRADRSYRMLLRNSNTVVGCLLAESGASVDRVADSSAESLVRLRLPGIGFQLGVLDADSQPALCARTHSVAGSPGAKVGGG